jgi:hypothetical protein
VKRFFLLLPLFITACGTLPQPFYGDPGIEGAKLSAPPPPVLIIPTPTNALLADDSAKLYAQDLAAALANLDVPSLAAPAGKRDWKLITTATLNGNNVTPSYAITGPDGKSYGTQTGQPVNAATWANGDPEALNQAATTDAATLCKLLTNVNATVQQSNPQSLENRPARVFMGTVTGAPTDGNNALSLNLMRDLPDNSLVLVNNKTNADFTINGIVTTQPDTNHQILVQINWLVTDSNNRKIGQVTQLHDLNPSDITPYWGDIAAAAASEGATGIQEVITNATLHRKTT